jgi:hypothetical protein
MLCCIPGQWVIARNRLVVRERGLVVPQISPVGVRPRFWPRGALVTQVGCDVLSGHLGGYEEAPRHSNNPHP